MNPIFPNEKKKTKRMGVPKVLKEGLGGADRS